MLCLGWVILLQFTFPWSQNVLGVLWGDTDSEPEGGRSSRDWHHQESHIQLVLNDFLPAIVPTSLYLRPLPGKPDGEEWAIQDIGHLLSYGAAGLTLYLDLYY